MECFETGVKVVAKFVERKERMVEKLSEIAKEELKNRIKGMTTEELDVVLENIPVQYIASHLCCRVNLMQYKIQRMQEVTEGTE